MGLDFPNNVDTLSEIDIYSFVIGGSDSRVWRALQSWQDQKITRLQYILTRLVCLENMQNNINESEVMNKPYDDPDPNQSLPDSSKTYIVTLWKCFRNRSFWQL